MDALNKTENTLIKDPSCVELKEFSGPLDLLLQLIKQEEMDIFNINISEITHQYLEYLNQIPRLDLEKTGNFIRMATVLIYIKSETLLPKNELEQEETSDLKKDLTALLVTYKKIQEVSKNLYGRHLLGRDTWKSGAQWSPKPPQYNSVDIDPDKAVFLLIKNYGKLLHKTKKKMAHKVPAPLPSLLSRVKEIMSKLIAGAQLQFSQISKINQNNDSTFLTFLSILELSKLGFVSLFQKQNFSDIDIAVHKNVDESAFQAIDREEQDWMSKKLEEEFN